MLYKVSRLICIFIDDLYVDYERVMETTMNEMENHYKRVNEV
jgi:hypothetical protein